MDMKELIKNLIELNLASKSCVENLSQQNFNLENKVLFFIFCNEGCSPTELIEKFKIKKTNLAIICKNLISQGLIEKQKNTFDARALKYKTSDKANKLINQMLLQAESKSNLSEKKREELCLLIQKINKIIKN